APEVRRPVSRTPEPTSSDRRRLPKEALAKYLAGKRKAGESAAMGAGALAPNLDLPSEEEEDEVLSRDLESNQAEGRVVAGVTPQRRQAPKPQATAIVPPKPEVPAATVETPSGLKKTRIPGMVTFSKNDAVLDQASRSSLDLTAKHLLENPSSTLSLLGILGPGENSNYIDMRFESVRAYLRGRGVPEDQI